MSATVAARSGPSERLLQVSLDAATAIVSALETASQSGAVSPPLAVLTSATVVVVLLWRQVLAIILSNQLHTDQIGAEDLCAITSSCTAFRDWLASCEGFGGSCCISLQDSTPVYIDSMSKWLAAFGSHFSTMCFDAMVVGAMQQYGLLDSRLEDCGHQLGGAIVKSSSATLRGLSLKCLPFSAYHVGQLTNLQSLEVINADPVQLSPALPHLTSLTSLTFYDAKPEPEAEPSAAPPAQQADLVLPSSMRHLELTGFPLDVIDLPNLTHLKFAAPKDHVYNVPDVVASFTCLQHLDLSNTGGVGAPMQLIGQLTGLTQLGMVLDAGAYVAPLAGLQQLQVLEIIGSDGPVPAAALVCGVLVGLPSLHTLSMCGVGLQDGADAHSIAALTGLTSLSVDAPLVSEPCLMELFEAPGALSAVCRLIMVSCRTGMVMSRDVIRQLCIPGSLPALSYLFVNMTLSQMPVEILVDTFWVMRPSVIVETW